MAKRKNRDLPHHIKERLRHQNLQKVLEDVASHVPKPATTKRETKAKKLRRVVLYMKYLIHKNEELTKTKLVAKTTKCQDNSAKTRIASLEFPSKHNTKSKRANIVFLTKFSDVSENNLKDTETCKRCCGHTENQLELQTSKNSVNLIDQNRSKKVSSPENNLELYHDESIKSADNITDEYVPNGELANLSAYDLHLWREDYPAISKCPVERKISTSGNNSIFRYQNFSDGIERKENITYELNGNRTDLEQYVEEFSKDLEKLHKCNSSDESLFQSENLERSCIGVYHSKKEKDFSNSCKKLSSDAECSFYKKDRPCSFNEYLALKNYHSSCDVQVEEHEIKKPQSFSQNSDEISFEETSTYTSLDNFDLPHSCSKPKSPKKDQQYFHDIKKQKRLDSKYKFFSPVSDHLSPDFISSGESSTLTSLHKFEKSQMSSSAGPKNDHPNYYDNVNKHQLSKHPSFSQSSDNFSSEFFSSGESGALISSNENVLSENENIGLEDILIGSSNTSPDTLLKPESVMDEDSFDYCLTPSQRNCDIITSPDIFCDMQQDVHRVTSDFSVDNILSKSCIKNPPVFSSNSDGYLDYSTHEPNYSTPFIHNSVYSNVVDNRFINYYGMNNFSQNLPLSALPPFAQIVNYPSMNIENVARYSNFVQTDEFYAINTCCPGNPSDFNHSMYVNGGKGDYLCVPIKQEDTESFLPPDELSYSLNNFANSGYCFSQRNFNT